MKSYLVPALIAVGLGLAGCSDKSDTASSETTTAGGELAAPDVAANPAGTIIKTISASPAHKALAAAIAQAGLTQMLSGAGPFTVFAPADDAFNQVAPVTRDGWMRPDQKDGLAALLKYHVVPGKLTAADLSAKIAEGGGEALLKTADGRDLTARISGNSILLISASGNKAIVTQPDVEQANGVIHVVDAVLIPAG
ncbi:fasciclin domain-containing protein [Sphingopyxis panaciterrae]